MNNIGVIGLGVMGKNIALNMLNHGYKVSGYNRSFERTKVLIDENIPGFSGFEKLEDFVNSLEKPRRVFLMVPAGQPVDDVLLQLVDLLDEGDIIMDGGNSYFEDTNRRHKQMASHGLKYFGVGVSGGEEGALKGPSIMPSGDKDAYTSVGKILEDISAKKDGEPCCAYIGPEGSGHYVKMVHNGIEYGMMQAIGEGFDILHASEFDYDFEAVSHVWNHGSVVRSWLMELAEEGFAADPKLEKIEGVIDANGEAQWTIEEALRLNVPATVIAHSLFVRSASKIDNSFSNRVVATLRHGFGGHAVKTRK